MYVYAYMYTCMYVYAYMHTCMYVYVYMYIRMYVYAYMYIRMYVYADLYTLRRSAFEKLSTAFPYIRHELARSLARIFFFQWINKGIKELKTKEMRHELARSPRICLSHEFFCMHFFVVFLFREESWQRLTGR